MGEQVGSYLKEYAGLADLAQRLVSAKVDGELLLGLGDELRVLLGEPQVSESEMAALKEVLKNKRVLTFKDKSISTWSMGDVKKFLKSARLSKLESSFEKAEVDGRELMRLRDTERKLQKAPYEMSMLQVAWLTMEMGKYSDCPTCIEIACD